MKTDKAKVVHKIYGKEMIARVVETAMRAGIKDIVTIVGHKREDVEAVLKDSVTYAYQEELLGTGHTTMQAIPYLKDKKGKVVILYGDVPIVRPETLQKLIAKSIKEDNDATVLTAMVPNPTGYGRIIRDEVGHVKEIVEERDATEEQKKISEINSGLYCFDIQELISALEKITPNNVQGEYYLTDVIKIMNDKGLKVGAMIVEEIGRAHV